MTRGRSVRRFGLAVAVLVPLTISWSLGIGRYGGPDEPAHVLRSYAAAHGEVLGTSAAPLPAGYRYVTVPASLASGDPSCYRHDPEVDVAVRRRPIDDESPVRAATSAGLTPPLYHLAIGALVRIAGDPADTASYRVAAALLHALVLALVVARATACRPARGALLVATMVMVTPAAWFLFGVVNPNSLEIALALLAWTGVARLVADGTAASGVVSTRDVWWIGLPLAAAVVVRPIAAVLAAATVVIAVLIAESLRRSRRLAVTLVAPAIVAAAAQALWVLVVHVEIDDPRTAVDRSVFASLREAIGSLPTTAVEAVGALGWNEFRAPWWVMVAWAAMATACVATIAGRTRVRRGTAAVATWIAALVATPVVFEVVLAGVRRAHLAGPLQPADPGRRCGGRADRPRHVTGDPDERTPPSPPMVALVALVGLLEVTTYWATVRRYAVGTSGSWWLDGAVTSTVWISPTRLGARASGDGGDGRDGSCRRAPAIEPSDDVAEHVDDHVGTTRCVEHVELAAGAELQVRLVRHRHPGPRVHRRRGRPILARGPRGDERRDRAVGRGHVHHHCLGRRRDRCAVGQR